MNVRLENILILQSFTRGMLSLAVLAAFSGCSQEPPSTGEKSEPAHAHAAHENHVESHGAAVQPATPPRRAAQAHAHGRATLAVVLDGYELTAALETPLYNLVGFEHAAETQAQKAALRNAETLLAGGGPLLTFSPKAGCALSDKSISADLGGHDDHHDGHHAVEAEPHKDIALEYIYVCASPDLLNDITVNLFEHFEFMDEIELIYLGPNIQKQDVLNRNKTRVKLTRS